MASIGSDESSLAIGFAFPILGGLCVALRFYARLHLKNALMLDDWLCLPALLCVIGTCVSLLIRAFYDRGGQGSKEDEDRFTAQILGALAIFWAFANTFIKLSVLFFYRRIFFISRALYIATDVLITMSIIWLIYDVVGWFLFCGTDLRANFEGPWDNCPRWGYELQVGVFALNSLIDFCILIVPAPLVWKLQLNFSRKIAVTATFLLGGFAFFSGLSNTVVQGVFLMQPEFALEAGGGSFFQDVSILLYNWPALEVGVGLIACNIPSISFRLVESLYKRVKTIFGLRSHTPPPVEGAHSIVIMDPDVTGLQNLKHTSYSVDVYSPRDEESLWRISLGPGSRNSRWSEPV